MEQSFFKEVQGGYEVHPNRRMKLPGIFLNVFQAERALQKYEAEVRCAAKKRETRKASKEE